MNIAMLLSTPLPPREGIGFYAWNLSRYLVRQGHHVHLITRGSPRPTTRQEMDGITIWQPPFLPFYPLHAHLHSLYVDRLLKDLKPELDLLHLHTPLVKAPRTSLPVLVTVHTPMRSESRAIPLDNPLAWLIYLQTPFSLRLERELFRRADRLVAVASSVAYEMRPYGVDPASVAVLGNAADPSIFRPKYNHKRAASYFFTAGRLALRKGLEDLLACAEIVRRVRPEVAFWMAGDGPLKVRLRQKIASRGLDGGVRLLGHVSNRDELAELYRGAIACIQPSHYEGLPTVLIEAMACGCPCIATAVSGALDAIEDGENGLLVPPHDPDALAQAALRLLGDPALRRRLGKAARWTAVNRYSWEVVGRAYLEEYRRLLEMSRP